MRRRAAADGVSEEAVDDCDDSGPFSLPVQSALPFAAFPWPSTASPHPPVTSHYLSATPPPHPPVTSHCLSETPRQALVDLVVELHRQTAAAAAVPAAGFSAAAEEALRADLEGLKMRGLRARAAADGVPAEAVEEAEDDEHPKAALVELVVAQAHLSAAAPEPASKQKQAPPAELAVLPIRKAAAAQAAAAAAVEEAAAKEAPAPNGMRNGDCSVLLGWLDHAIELMDSRIKAVSRKKKADVGEAVEELVEQLDDSGTVQTIAERATSQDIAAVEELGRAVMALSPGRLGKADVATIERLVASVAKLTVSEEEQLAQDLRGGGAAAEQAIEAGLEQILEMMDSKIAGTPRKARCVKCIALEPGGVTNFNSVALIHLARTGTRWRSGSRS